MIVAVISGKGGVGKTTVAYNLAAAMEAVVVDADLGMADLPASHGPDLHDVLAGRATPIEAVHEETPVAVLPCGRTLAGARATEPRDLVDAVETVSAEYGHVVVDCPAGMGGDVGLALHAADACVLVTTPSETALSDAVRARALARELDAGLVSIVLNRADGAVSRDLVARELGAPVTRIPPSPSLERAQRDGMPVTHTAPESTAAERIRSVANAVQRNARWSSDLKERV